MRAGFAALCAILQWLMWTQASAALEMSAAVDENEKLVYINLVGDIVVGDDGKFHDLVLPYLQKGYSIWQVNIFSVGGNVGAAMRLGDQIRTLQTRTVTAYNEARIINNRRVATGRTSCIEQVQMNQMTMIKPVSGARWCTCTSACFIVWASGVTRDGGRVGIHRLFWLGPEFGNLPVAAARVRYAAAQKEYLDYLRKLSVPQTIIDRMFATDSKSIYYLTLAEQQLMQSTPYLEEMTYSRCGVSKTEHMSRKNHWTMTEDINHINCYRGILKEVIREGTQKYLAAYGQEIGSTPAPAASNGH
jgi:hypothetical protein